MDSLVLTIKITNMILDKNYISKILPIPKVSFFQEDYLIQFVEENVQPSSYTVKYTVRPKGANGDSGDLSDWQISPIPR